ncbi:MAG: hypothetical protein KDE34_13205 [Anaerolineales bacterium]|nr:hypothetical protein [Anaerolineales bacterium]
MYDWHTDEEVSWSDEKPEPAGSPRPRWLWLSIPLVLLIAGGLIYWQINRRVAATTARLQDDVLSSHQLVEQAVVKQDGELLTSLLSGREPAWTEAQQALLDADFWQTGSFLGWRVRPVVDEPVAITFDSEFREATVATAVKITLLGDETREMTLTREQFYRQGETRWLLAPPPEDYWGNSRLIQNQFFSLTAPARDADFGRALANSVERRLDRLCQEFVAMCGVSEGRLAIELSTDPQTLLAVSSRPVFLSGTEGVILLPAPSLIGLPPAGPENPDLLSAYETYLMTAIVADWVDYDCCQHGLYFAAFNDLLLDGLGVPVLAANDLEFLLAAVADFAASAADPATLSVLAELYAEPWPSLRTDQWLVMTWALYWGQGSAPILPSDLIDALLTLPQHNDFATWFSSLKDPLPLELDAADAEAGWPALAQDVAILCQEPAPAVYLYSPISQQWQTLLAPPGQSAPGARLQPLPNQAGVYVSLPTVIDGDVDWLTLLWQGSTMPVRFDNTLMPAPLLYTGRSDTTGQRLLVYQRDPDSGNLDFAALDLAACTSENCALTPLAGIPVWSPDGTRTLVQQGAYLYAGDISGTPGERLYRGVFPFWLTADSYGFLRAVRFSDATGALVAEMGVLVSENGAEAEERLGSFDLIAHIPEAPADLRLKIERVEPHPYLEDLLLVVASDNEREHFYVVEVQGLAASAAPTIRLLYTGTAYPAQLHFSRDPRWLGVTTFGAGENELEFRLLDRELLRQGAPLTGRFAQPIDDNHWAHWSADGQNLLLLSDEALTLVQPNAGQSYRLPLPYAGCRDVAWLAPLREP